MPLCFDEDERNSSPVLDRPQFLFSVDGRTDIDQAQLHECSNPLASEGFFLGEPEPSVAAENPQVEPASPVSPQEVRADLEAATPVASGTSLERLYSYLSTDFKRFDLDQNGCLGKIELESALSTKTNSDELALLSWMGKNFDALQKLGDKHSEISMDDLDGLNTAIDKGTGDIGLAFRNTKWLERGLASVSSGMIAGKLYANLQKSAFSGKVAGAYGLGAFAFLSACDAVGYYLFDKPNIDRAVKELNEIPNPNATKGS